MTFKCDDCDYVTKSQYSFDKHILTDKHKKNVENNIDLKKYLAIEKKKMQHICDKCGGGFLYSSLLIRHAKSCSGKNVSDTDKQKITRLEDEVKNLTNSNTELLKDKYNSLEELRKEKDKLLEELRKEKDDVICALQNEIKVLQGDKEKILHRLYENKTSEIKEVKNYSPQNSQAAKDINETKMSKVKYLQKFCGMCPAIQKIIEPIGLEEKEEDIIINSLNNHEMDAFDQYIGDFLIKKYKKEDLRTQPLWCTDVSRITYNIRQEIGDNIYWYNDEKGLKTRQQLIDPTLSYIRNILQKYVLAQQEIFKMEINQDEKLTMRKKITSANDLLKDLRNHMGSKILKYIMLHFKLDDQAKNNILQSFNSSEKKEVIEDIKVDDNSKKEICPSCKLYEPGGEVCEYCVKISENKKYRKTKEYLALNFLEENLQKELGERKLIHNKSVGSECTDSHLFPDITIDCGHYNLIIEIDEFEHKGGNYKYEEKRMYDIVAKLGMRCIFIRYNPDDSKSDLEILLKTVREYLDLDIENNVVQWGDYKDFVVYYLFYRGIKKSIGQSKDDELKLIEVESSGDPLESIQPVKQKKKSKKILVKGKKKKKLKEEDI
ncbi:MAG: hypothetical protein Harvfovirus26_7 [Harvfovirus sp.]|uniref:C2H2-type domain-containing protein n=1 Tax=Harvfovirus sp. TaxID=2487768 RepID=A0A3G5A765_9VIRU|nr:MAG: hypothetical protein Harvfovirus26_7 [Harvfovirus sp.]